MTAPEATQTSTEQVAESFIAAYNAGDLEALSRAISDDIHLVHRNQELDLHGRAAAEQFFADILAAFPDRRFVDRELLVCADSRVLTVHAWQATATVDVPGMAAAGDAVRIEVVTLLTILDGRVVGFEDFG